MLNIVIRAFLKELLDDVRREATRELAVAEQSSRSVHAMAEKAPRTK